MIETFKIEENSHRVSPQIDKRFNILCSEERPAGYCHDSEIHTENKDWMKNLSDRNVRITKLYLLAELIQCILNSANGLVVNEVYVLQNGKCTNFANDSGKQTIRYFRVVPDDQELVCKL